MNTPIPAELSDVNTTDIRDAIDLGCRVMQRVFNADDDRCTPYFSALVFPEARLDFHPCHGESHVPGRHLNALLNAEDAVGIPIDESAVTANANSAFFSYSGPAPLPLNRQEIGGALVNFCAHNLREGMHALAALVEFRESQPAREVAERSIAAVLDLWHPESGWDTSRIRALELNLQESEGFIGGEARMIGPLVKYYRVTRSEAALELALRFKDKAVAEFFLEDGSFDGERFITTHVHSITSVLSSLAQLAEELDDKSLMTRVKAFYDNGLWKMRDEIGWSPETLGRHDADHGEANNTGDILETALILGRHGHVECFQDAERILRCHLLPSQLRDISFIEALPNPSGSDGLRDVAARLQGAFGFPAAYGHYPFPEARNGSVCFNLDIVGGVVGSLCEAWRAAVSFDERGHWINLMFDRETAAIRVESSYANGNLRVTLKKPGPLHVRLPDWAPLEKMGFEGAVPRVVGGYLIFDELAVGSVLTIHFPLPETQLELSRDLHPRPIRVSLRGDAVTAIDTLGTSLTFFPALPANDE